MSFPPVRAYLCPKSVFYLVGTENPEPKGSFYIHTTNNFKERGLYHGQNHLKKWKYY